MSVLFAGWDVASLMICLRERIETVEAMCRIALDGGGYWDGKTAAELAEAIKTELDGGDE